MIQNIKDIIYSLLEQLCSPASRFDSHFFNIRFLFVPTDSQKQAEY